MSVEFGLREPLALLRMGGSQSDLLWERMEKQLKEEGLGPKQNTGKSKLSQLTLS